MAVGERKSFENSSAGEMDTSHARFTHNTGAGRSLDTSYGNGVSQHDPIVHAMNLFPSGVVGSIGYKHSIPGCARNDRTLDVGRCGSPVCIGPNG